MDRRSDYKTALMVEAIIHAAPATGQGQAARELAALGVPLEVAMRVLTRPGERRHQIPPLNPHPR
ncbi:hypothetical protein [Massilia niastensis]|uniref:hypothetical protein n=1 Tax=Massilia niastensis TaxID=544911 RepID=UPI00035C6ED7|nr:hypothetical protein [Massilia niastensis]